MKKDRPSPKSSTVTKNKSPTSRPQRAAKKPQHFEDYEVYNAYCLLSRNNYDPETYEEAVTDIEWQKAINSELDSRNKLGTWEASTLPPNERPIDIKWIFKPRKMAQRRLAWLRKAFSSQLLLMRLHIHQFAECQLYFYLKL